MGCCFRPMEPAVRLGGEPLKLFHSFHCIVALIHSFTFLLPRLRLAILTKRTLASAAKTVNEGAATWMGSFQCGGVFLV